MATKRVVSSFFVPYSGSRPACVSINGHRVIILSPDRNALDECLDLLGADKVREVSGGDSPQEQERLLLSLAQSVRGGVVVATGETDVQELVHELEYKLPWLQ